MSNTREHGGTLEDLRADADPERAADEAAAAFDAWLVERWDEMLRLLDGADTLTTAEYVGGKSGEKYAALCAALPTLAPGAPQWERAAELWESIGFYARARKPEKPAWEARLAPAREIADDLRKRDLDADREAEREAARRRVRVRGWAAGLWAAFEAFKAEQHAFDFQDLQLRALQLLRNERVRDEYRRQFRHILLDEAQDTNPLQYRILKECLWGDANAFFAVGDAKQAIYGFRAADLELFLGMIRDAGGARTDLEDNFRSRGELLDAVNAAGRAFWAENPLLGDFTLRPGLDYPADPEPRARVECCVVEQRVVDEMPPAPGSSSNGRAVREPLPDTREREARWVAERLQRLVDGGFQVFDAGEQRMRPFGWGDAAVLLRTRNYAPFEQAFRDAGIPFVSVGGKGFFDGLEVRDVLNGLAVVANPLDDVALLSALRSPLCGLSDDALVALRMAQPAPRPPYWQGLEAADLAAEDAERLQRFVSLVRRLRLLRDAAPPVELLRRLIDGTDYRAVVFADEHGRARAANLTRLEDFAREARDLSLRGFLQRARRAARYLSDNPDAPLAERGDPAVTLCTVHRAKGLEWPVVFLADLAAEYWKAADGSGVTSDGRLYLSVKRDGVWYRPVRAQALRAELDRASAEEAQRLFYVGMTRARELLVLSGAAADGEAVSEPWAQRPIHWLRAQLGLGGELGTGPAAARWGEAAVGLEWVRAEDPQPRPADRSRSLFALHAAHLRDGRSIGDGAHPAVAQVVRTLSIRQPAVEQLAVTRLMGFFRCPLVYRFSELGLPEYPPRPQTGAAGGTDLGNLVHQAMQLADFHADPGAEAHRLAHALPTELPAEAVEMVEWALRSPLAAEIRAAGANVQREVPFYLPLRGGDGPVSVLHGIVDLAFRDPGGAWHIVDWKTNAIHDEARLQTLTLQYTPQIQLYAAALQAVYHTVASGRLVFLGPRRIAAVPVDRRALDDVLAAARGAVQKIGAGDYETRPGAKCETCGYRRGKWCEVGMRSVPAKLPV